jgi:hypothetical protein
MIISTERPKVGILLDNLEDDLDEFFWENCDLGDFSEFIYKSLETLITTLIEEINEVPAGHPGCD